MSSSRARWRLLADAPIGWAERAIGIAADAGCLPPPGAAWCEPRTILRDVEAGKPPELGRRLLALAKIGASLGVGGTAGRTPAQPFALGCPQNGGVPYGDSRAESVAEYSQRL